MIGRFEDVLEHAKSIKATIESIVSGKCYISYCEIDNYLNLKKYYEDTCYKIELANKYNIIVLEQSNKAARKILASGNGRCNVSNLNMDIKYYNHQDPLIEKLIKEFDVVNFFKQLSLKLRYAKNLFIHIHFQVYLLKML